MSARILLPSMSTFESKSKAQTQACPCQAVSAKNIMSGFANQNTATIAIKLAGNKLELAGYAREGIIKQHTVEKAVEVLKNIF